MSNNGNIRRQAPRPFQQLQQQPFSDEKATSNLLPSTSFHTKLKLYIPTVEEMEVMEKMEEMEALLSVLASTPDAIFLDGDSAPPQV
jgi:hypothetical protein